MTTTSTVGLESTVKVESLPGLLAQLVPARQAPASTEVVQQIPKHVALTAPVRSSMEELLTGVAVLNIDERRALAPTEVERIADEREQLDRIETWIKGRKETHKTMVYNHLDVTAEADGSAVDVERDDKGHLILAGRVVADERGIAFSREVVAGSPVLTAEALAAVAVDPNHPEFDHDEYIACTTAVRVIDEAKVMLVVRAKPSILDALRAAVTMGRAHTSHYKRKA